MVISLQYVQGDATKYVYIIDNGMKWKIYALLSSGRMRT